MKRLLFLLLAILAFVNGNSQIKKPVKWTSKTEKISDTEFNLVMNATIEQGWHMYSQYTPEDGPLPLVVTVKDQKGNFELVGKTKESPYKKEFNKDFGVEEFYFEGKATLAQRVKITNPKTSKIVINLDFQACQNQCVNDNIDLTFALPITSDKVVPVSNLDTLKSNTSTVIIPKTKQEASASTKIDQKKEDKKGIWSIFFLAFLAGFGALLTPCVFPLIPMTVSFFTKQSKNQSQGKRNAILYGISIILIYVIIGISVTAIFGADALNSFSTNVWFNVIFFILLIFFAFSFLGAFEIVLPNSWANKVDKQAEKGGIIGILFMALALAIVSFSCTGPFVGNILFAAASKGGGIGPVIGMFGFSLAIALPFMFFAFFPSWLQSLPKSGGWLNTVKVSLGFIELAFAFKFLSNADLVLQLHWFERETFLAIWIAIFGTWGIYLLGKITLPHDSPITHISVGRLILSLLVISFTFYMIPGLFGAPLKLISAYIPAQKDSESPHGFYSDSNSNVKLPDGAERNEYGLMLFTDYKKGMAFAKEVNKPVLLDFTGHACSNCRKMETNVWTDEQVSQILKNEVVLISLFADDKRELPKSEQHISPSTGAEIVTIGDKWTDFMITKYKTNTQPLYVLVDVEGNNLNSITPTTSYDPDAKLYENWLKQGIANFKK